MTARQGKLFDIPRPPARVMAHVSDAGEGNCGPGDRGLIYSVRYTCRACVWASGWIGGRTVTEHKTGWPCPNCNSEGSGNAEANSAHDRANR